MMRSFPGIYKIIGFYQLPEPHFLKETLMKAADRTDDVDETIHRLRSGAHQTVDKVANKGEQLKNAEQQFVENCRSYFHDNPVTTLGIAAGAGFLLSRLISGR